MKCSICGQECADDLRFCTNCGRELPEKEEVVAVEVQNEVIDDDAAGTEVIKIDKIEIEEGNNKKKKTREEKKAEKQAKKAYTDAEKAMSPFANPVVIGIAAAVVLFAIIIIAVVSGDKAYIKLSAKAIVDVYEVNDKYYVRLKNEEKVELNDESMNTKVYSMDKTTLGYVNENAELMIVKDGEIIKTGIEDVTGMLLSSKGDTVAYFSDQVYSKYMTDYGYEDTIKTGTLNLYFIDKKKNVEIETEVVIDSAVLSPDGETVAYVAEYDATDDFRGFYSVKGRKPVEVGKEKRVFAIADKAKYLYYMDVDRIYAQKKGKEEEKLASDLRNVEALLNKDHTELLYMYDGKTYVSVKAGEKKKVSGKKLNSVVFPESVAYGSNVLSTENGSITVSYTGVDTFKEKVLYNESERTLVYLKENYEDEKLASDARDYAISDDYESLIYLDNGEIVHVTDFNKGGTKTDLDDEANARSLYADGNLKYIYYINDDAELYCLKGKRAKKIADDVTSACVSYDGTYCYYVVEGEKCCYSKKGGKGKQIMEDDDYSMEVYRHNATVYMEATQKLDVDVYRINGKEMEFERTYEMGSIYSIQDIFDYFE